MKKTKDKAYINGTKYIHSAFYNDRYVIIYIYTFDMYEFTKFSSGQLTIKSEWTLECVEGYSEYSNSAFKVQLETAFFSSFHKCAHVSYQLRHPR